MKKIFFTSFLLSISVLFVLAQVPSQAEIDKLMKNAQELAKKYGNDSAVKNAVKNQQANTKSTTNTFYSSDSGDYGKRTFGTQRRNPKTAFIKR